LKGKIDPVPGNFFLEPPDRDASGESGEGGLLLQGEGSHKISSFLQRPKNSSMVIPPNFSDFPIGSLESFFEDSVFFFSKSFPNLLRKKNEGKFIVSVREKKGEGFFLSLREIRQIQGEKPPFRFSSKKGFQNLFPPGKEYRHRSESIGPQGFGLPRNRTGKALEIRKEFFFFRNREKAEESSDLSGTEEMSFQILAASLLQEFPITGFLEEEGYRRRGSEEKGHSQRKSFRKHVAQLRQRKNVQLRNLGKSSLPKFCKHLRLFGKAKFPRKLFGRNLPKSCREGFSENFMKRFRSHNAYFFQSFSRKGSEKKNPSHQQKL